MSNTKSEQFTNSTIKICIHHQTAKSGWWRTFPKLTCTIALSCGVTGNRNNPSVVHACRKTCIKWTLSARGIAGTPCLRGIEIRRPDLPVCASAWGWLLRPVKQILPRNPKRCKPDEMRRYQPRQRKEWSGEASLGQSRLESGCSTNMTMMIYGYCCFIVRRPFALECIWNLQA